MEEVLVEGVSVVEEVESLEEEEEVEATVSGKVVEEEVLEVDVVLSLDVDPLVVAAEEEEALELVATVPEVVEEVVPVVTPDVDEEVIPLDELVEAVVAVVADVELLLDELVAVVAVVLVLVLVVVEGLLAVDIFNKGPHTFINSKSVNQSSQYLNFEITTFPIFPKSSPNKKYPFGLSELL